MVLLSNRKNIFSKRTKRHGTILIENLTAWKWNSLLRRVSDDDDLNNEITSFRAWRIYSPAISSSTFLTIVMHYNGLVLSMHN